MSATTDSPSSSTVSRLRPRDLPFVRDCGFGSVVLCLHASLGSSSQWRPLMESLGASYRVVAPDLYGYGRSPDWQGDRKLRLSDELALIEPLFEIIDEPVHLVGHSYGAAIALQAAIHMPSRVKSLVLYEPVLFSLLLHGQGTHPAELEVRSLRDDVVRAMDGGDVLSAARRFVDYWVGENSWDTIPLSRRQIMLDGMLKVRAEWDTPYTDDTPLEAYRGIDVPTLLLHGADSPAPMRRLANLMGRLFPRAHSRELGGVGHMAPITHPMRINREIGHFLGRIDPPRSIAA